MGHPVCGGGRLLGARRVGARCEMGRWLLGDGLAVLGCGRAGAEEVAVAVGVVDAVDRGPVLVGAAAVAGETALSAGVRTLPVVVRDVVDGVGGVAER